jgi:hypothetical protein
VTEEPGINDGGCSCRLVRYRTHAVAAARRSCRGVLLVPVDSLPEGTR